MYQHIKNNNLCLSIYILKSNRVMTFMAVNYKQPVYPYSTRLRIYVKVLQLFNFKLIYYPAVSTNSNTLVLYIGIIVIPATNMVLTRENCKGQDRLPKHINCVNNYSPLIIAQLNSLLFPTPFRACNNQLKGYYTHYKACFIKVVGICVLDTVLFFYKINKLKPQLNSYWVFIQGLLLIIYISLIYSKLVFAFNKLIQLVNTYSTSFPLCQQLIGYIAQYILCRRKPS